MTKKKVLGIIGSTRKNSANELILNTIADIYKSELSIEIFKGLADLPHFNPDTDDIDVNITVKNFREQVADADGVVICTPEYVFSLPSILKNALEWTVSTTVFSDKPVALIVASGAGEKTYESLELIMKTLGARIGESSKLLIQGARAKFNTQRQLPDQATLSEIRTLMTSFIESMH